MAISCASWFWMPNCNQRIFDLILIACCTIVGVSFDGRKTLTKSTGKLISSHFATAISTNIFFHASYSHLTLPTTISVLLSVVEVSLNKISSYNWSSSKVTIIPLWHSPNSNSSSRSFLSMSNLAPIQGLACMIDSAIFTESPPSDKSWTDLIIPFLIASKQSY
mgnify:CR=1 FL=1